MAKAILLVKDKKPVGVFTQLKKTYGAIEQLEGKTVTENCDEISNLMLPFPKESKSCNYARLNKFMNDNSGRAALFTTENTEYPIYTIYQFEINSILGSTSEESVDESSTEE